MKRIILLIALSLSITAYGQNFGVGLRLGDLSGLSLKKYIDENNTFEVSFGRTYLFNGKSLYDHYFEYWYDKHKSDYDAMQYLGYKASAPLGIQAHYLLQNGLKKVTSIDISGFKWYLGFGAQLMYQHHSYEFKYKKKGDPAWYYDDSYNVSEINLGADCIIGAEYTFENMPISAFIDFTLFVEGIDDPFNLRGQGGIGFRYDF